MKKEILGQLIIDSEETMYHIAKSLLYNDADCADAIQEAIVKAFAKLHTLKDDSYAKTWLLSLIHILEFLRLYSAFCLILELFLH